MILTNVQFLEFIYPKIFFAVITGSIIGFERGSRKAAAGFKTHILICLGAMFYTVVPVVLGRDMVVSDQHVIAQIVTGIGFLGAGAIIRNTATEKQPVQGHPSQRLRRVVGVSEKPKKVAQCIAAVDREDLRRIVDMKGLHA